MFVGKFSKNVAHIAKLFIDSILQKNQNCQELSSQWNGSINKMIRHMASFKANFHVVELQQAKSQ